MVKVHIEMDDGWQWFPVTEVNARNGHTMEINEALLEEYKQASTAYYQVMNKLEQLYRVQEKKKPWAEPPVPEHKVLI